jgi:hypothetical protein
VDKTIIGARTVQYLGYTLSGQGVMLSKDKLAAIKDFPMPTLPKAEREFMRTGKLLKGAHSKVLPDGGPSEQDDKSVNSLEYWGTTPARGIGSLQQAQGGIDVSTDHGEPKQGGEVHTANGCIDRNRVGGERHGSCPATRAKGQDGASGRIRVKRTKGLRDELPSLSIVKGRGMLGDRLL